jgi:osmotically-inducible protein OsmY
MGPTGVPLGPLAVREGFEDERGPYWGKGPKGYKRNDERTREDVSDAIAYQGHIDASDVEVKVESGVVTLSGTVAEREQKRALERLVERCRGVHEVRNELRLPRDARS